MGAEPLTGMRLVLILSALAAVATAAPLEFASGPERTHVIELFTSEGCSSCPPAEAWLAGLDKAPGLWRDFVPVAWHVDYWDRLGWKDRFASHEFTQRQHAYAEVWRSGSVYTPCVVVDGQESEVAAKLPLPRTATGAGETGVLNATYEGGTVSVSFKPSQPGDYEVRAALLSSNIASAVTAGENRGRTLRHGFVVRTTSQAPLRDGAARLALTPPASEASSRLALAVWIVRRGQLAPLQATGGWL